MALSMDLTWSLVISAYQDEEINLGKAASLLDMHELELRDQFIKLGIPLRIGPATIAEAHAEVQAMDSGFAEDMTLNERMEMLTRSGFAIWNGGRLTADMPTIKTKGDKTVSQLVIEDREFSNHFDHLAAEVAACNDDFTVEAVREDVATAIADARA